MPAINQTPTSRFRSWALPGLLLVIGLACRLVLAWQDHQVLLSEYLWYDDSFLALSVARNLALGQGMTSDGVNATNGFQPLYVFLLVPIFALVPKENLTLPIHLAGSLLALAGTGAAAFFYATALKVFSRTTALCVLFLYLFSTYFLAMDVNGLETAIYGLALSATLYYYVTRFTSLQPASRSQAVVLGVLAGLAVLARVDAVVFVFFMALDFLRRRTAASLKRVALGAAAFVMTLAPWLAASFILCGTIMPVSGPAVRLASARMGWTQVGNFVGHEGPHDFPLDEVPWEYYANNVLHLTAQTIALMPLTAQIQGFQPTYPSIRSTDFECGRWLARHPWTMLIAIGLVSVAALIIPPLVWRPAARPGSRLADLMFLRLPIVAWVALYAFYVFGPWYTYRYLYPVLALLTLLSGGLIEMLIRFLSAAKRKVLRRVVLGGAALSYTFLFISQAGHYYTAHLEHYEPDRYTWVLPWIRQHIPSDAVVGAFQSGILSYFMSPTPCINLDGVVNADALRALRANRSGEYIHKMGIEYLVDWPVVVESILTPEARRPIRLVLAYDGQSMWVYRVERDGAGRVSRIPPIRNSAWPPAAKIDAAWLRTAKCGDVPSSPLNRHRTNL